MKKSSEYKYYIVGGQYISYCHGGAKTLLGAKRKASKCVEHWDNWQGFHVPVIYKSEDMIDGHSEWYGEQPTPKDFAEPVSYKIYGDNRWNDKGRDY